MQKKKLYYSDYQFWKCSFQKSTFFLAPFFAVCGSLLADIIRVFWPKKSKDIWSDILFFFVISFFFCWKKFQRLKLAQKKKDITFKVKDITFQFDFRPVFWHKTWLSKNNITFATAFFAPIWHKTWLSLVCLFFLLND